jgi:hypothetical protein
VSNWEVPAFLFRIHTVAFQQLEALSQTGNEAKEIPGRTGDDLLAFQRDSSGEIVRILYCEAKCTADHDSGMISKAYEKASKSVPVDFLQYIEVLRDSNKPSAWQWVDAIRRARSKKTHERYDLVSYICGRHPKRNSVWLPTTKPHRNYKETRRLEAVETQLYDVDSLVQEVYGKGQPTDNEMQSEETQQDETLDKPTKETLDLAVKLREKLAGTTIPKSFAKLYSQHTLLGGRGTGLVSWSETETLDCLDDAMRLLEAAFTERDGGNDNWHESVRRAGEILEWLSHSQLNDDDLPTRYLSAAAYQLAGYPARSSGLLNADPEVENESKIHKFLLKAEFPNLLAE